MSKLLNPPPAQQNFELIIKYSLNCILLKLLLAVGRLLFALSLVVALSEAVEDGDDEVGHHRQYKLFEQRGQNVALRPLRFTIS